MIVFPNAKINIGLNVVRRRDDGFHDIETIMFPVPLCDALEFNIARGRQTGDTLTISGIEIDSPPEDNLVMRAAATMRAIYDIPFLNIHLHKVIPPGSGLGGGSSDAAALINAIDSYFALEAGREKLCTIASQLGSDCPFFILNSPALATGRGERLKPVPLSLKGYYLVIVREDIHISTAEAYRWVTQQRGKEEGLTAVTMPPEKWQGRVVNDFESPLFKRHPLLADIKEELMAAGAIYCSLTGSGSALYGIFQNRPATPTRYNLVWEGWPD